VCGRFTQSADLQTLEIRFGFSAPATELSLRFNVAPMQFAPVVALEDGERRLKLMRWGLLPSWAKDEALAGRLINARAETIADKPSFRQALKSRRCLVLADGFFEWAKSGAGKLPHYFYLRGGEPFAFAGLWERWTTPEGEALLTFTIITTAPNDLVKPVHDRMPVVLRREDEQAWLDPATGAEELAKLLVPYAPELMASHPVSRLAGVHRPAPRLGASAPSPPCSAH